MVKKVWLTVIICAMAVAVSPPLSAPPSVRAATPADIPQPNPLIATGSWNETFKQHPRLLGPPEFLRALAKDRPQGYREAKQLASKNSSQAYNVMAAGVVHAVEGMPAQQAAPFIQNAMRRVAKGVTNVHQDTWIDLEFVALTYDLLYDHISPGDRAKMINWFNGHIGPFTIDEGAFHNSTLSKIFCLLRIAYATRGDNPKAKEFRDWAIIKLYEGKIVPVLHQFGAGGGFTECGWYTRGSMFHLVQGLELARRFENYDGFAKAPVFFYQRLAYELHQPYPMPDTTYGADRFAVEGDGANTYGGQVEFPGLMKNILAQYFRGSELAAYTAGRLRKGSNDSTRFHHFLIDEPPDAVKPIATAPLSHLAEGIGRLYARSDWSNEATWLRFECGPFFINHQHLETGNFEIFRYEPLATESGEYMDWGGGHAINWLIRTVAHNCILVYAPNEQWPKMRDGSTNVANDGGQRYAWPAGGNIDTWNANRDAYERGKIVAYGNRAECMYVGADCTKSFNPDKVSLWVRQIAFIRPSVIIVFDRIVSKQANAPKAWLLHCKHEPTINGNKVHIKNGRGEMHVETLLPAEAKVSKIHGYKYPDFAGGKAFPAPHSALTPVAEGLWRMEVSPTKHAEEDLFLHVISTDGPITSKLTMEPNRVSVQIGQVNVAFTNKCGGEVTMPNKSFKFPERVVKRAWE
ncbi:MAG: hypothetical protein FWD53_00975 [Phycisphaerales bacterium]|nr:hypothetical protein [Phycisphaerales bacterium]